MDKNTNPASTVLAAIVVVIVAAFYIMRALNSTTCGDGSISYSAGRGTCSHHGGVR